MSIPISSLYLVISVLLIIKLAANVIKFRRSEKIGLGDGGSENIQVAMRAHANALEFIPMFILLLVAAELNGAHKIVLHSFGIAFVIARIMHAWGFNKTQGKYSKGRFFGTLISILSIVGLCVVNIISIWPKLI